jgi:hypothetical protein
MKTTSKILSAIAFFSLLATASATPFFYKGYNKDGTLNSNLVNVTIYQPSAATPIFSVYGTNIIYGGNVMTLAPDATAYASNWLFPGVYKFTVSNLNASFVAVIPDATNFLSLALYMTNVPVYPGVSLSSFQLITNLLGYTPPTNTLAGLTNAMGLIPANAANTNDFARTTADGLSQAIGALTSAKVITNGGLAIIAYKTNGLPGSAFTNYPTGSKLFTTNGQEFRLTNSVWIQQP